MHDCEMGDGRPPASCSVSEATYKCGKAETTKRRERKFAGFTSTDVLFTRAASELLNAARVKVVDCINRYATQFFLFSKIIATDLREQVSVIVRRSYPLPLTY